MFTVDVPGQLEIELHHSDRAVATFVVRRSSFVVRRSSFVHDLGGSTVNLTLPDRRLGMPKGES